VAKYKIVISDYYYPNLDAEYAVFEQLGGDVEIIDCTKLMPGGALTPEQLIPIAKDADAIIVQFAKVTAEVIASMEKCRVIARYAIGVDTINVQAAREKNIFVANVPNYCIDEVADTAMAHLLCGMRKIISTRDLLLSGQFSMDKIMPMKRIETSTLCLVGFGRIAQNVARKSKAFFKRIIAVDPYVANSADYPDVEFMTLNEALLLADAISLHAPLNDHTRHMISGEQFALMKDGVMIVNTSRGGLIDETALLVILNSDKVCYCGFDVVSTEDFMNSPLLKYSQVALTPHIGWYSKESIGDLQRSTAENVVAVLQQGKPLYYV
jgi:D-3-phosphoglycerate dehydrogenase